MEYSTSSPLLLSFASADESQLPQPPENSLPSLGSTVERCLSELNLSQFLQALLVSFAWFFDGHQTFITVFTDAQPPPSSTATRYSTISEWGLNPDDAILTGLPASSFFMGCLMGGLLLSTLADTSLGRKNMLFYSCLLMSLSSFLAAFSPNLFVYACFKFLSGFGRATIATSSLVLATELVGKRWRGQVGVMGFLCFFFGFLSLPGIAYLNRNSSWRNLYIYTSIPAILYCVLVKIFVRESPRWLLLQGRKEEAANTLRCIASISQSSLTLAISRVCEADEECSDENNNNVNNMNNNNNNNNNVYSALKVLMQKQWASRRMTAVVLMGFGIGLVYYGLPLGLGTVPFNLYLSVMFNALAELPASLLILVLIDNFNRRSCILVFTMVSGIFSVLSVMELGVTWGKLQIVFELVSFLCATTAFNVYLLCATELFPTCVRNLGLSMARQAAVLGGAVSPVVVAAGRKNKFLCYGVFGLVIGLSGMCGVMLVPETRGRKLCDTLEEEEESKQKLISSDTLV